MLVPDKAGIAQLEYALSIFPNYQDTQMKGQLEIIGQDLSKTRALCCICGKSSNPYHMKKLFCSHNIDQQCLLERFTKNLVVCPLDGIPFL